MLKLKKWSLLSALALTAVFAVGAAVPAVYKHRTIAPMVTDAPSAERFADAVWSKLPDTGKPRNVILIIGDGMGAGAIAYGGLYGYGKAGTTLMEQLPAHGVVTTYSADRQVTDSAASGTALATGVKTNNGFIGMNPTGKQLNTIAEAARDSGRSVGILTTDLLTGATPAAFMAHTNSRKSATAIAEGALNSKFDILIGGDGPGFHPRGKGGERTDERDIGAEFQRAGYHVIDGVNAFSKAPDGKVFGLYNMSASVTEPATFAKLAFARLARNPQGFFMMFEIHYPDIGGHGNDPNLTRQGVQMVDHLLKAAVEFALANPDTLIVVTADHETGSINAAPNPHHPRRPWIRYGGTSHSATPVPVFAVGRGSQYFNAALDNTEIAPYLAGLLKLNLNNR